MTIFTLVYYFENINHQELEEIADLENSVDLTEFYLSPPEWLVKKTINAILDS